MRYHAWPFLRPALAFAIVVYAGASLAGPLPGCAAVDRTRPLGQSSPFGSPFTIAPGVERVEVDVFGAERLTYEVDVTLDASCNVLRASPRLESGRTFLR